MSKRFSISEIEDENGNINEWIVSDSEGEYDPCSFDDEQEALDELQILEDETRVKGVNRG